MPTVGPAYISPVVHDFNVSSCSVPCQGVKMEGVDARMRGCKDARRDIQAVARVD